MHMMPWALVLALAKAGNSRAARMAMMAITTKSSINVKPRLREALPARDRVKSFMVFSTVNWALRKKNSDLAPKGNCAFRRPPVRQGENSIDAAVAATQAGPILIQRSPSQETVHPLSPTTNEWGEGQ